MGSVPGDRPSDNVEHSETERVKRSFPAGCRRDFWPVESHSQLPDMDRRTVRGVRLVTEHSCTVHG